MGEQMIQTKSGKSYDEFAPLYSYGSHRKNLVVSLSEGR